MAKHRWDIVPTPVPTKTGRRHARLADRLNPLERMGERVRHKREIRNWYKGYLANSGQKYSQWQWARPWGVWSMAKKKKHKLKYPNAGTRFMRRGVVWWGWGAAANAAILNPLQAGLVNDQKLEGQPSDTSLGRPQQLAEKDSITGNTDDPVFGPDGQPIPEAEGLTESEWRERLLEGNAEAIEAHGFATKERALTDWATDNASRILAEEGTTLHEVVRESKFSREDADSPSFNPANAGYPVPASLAEMIENSNEVEIFTDVHWEVTGSGDGVGKIVQIGRRVAAAEIARETDLKGQLQGWDLMPDNQDQTVIASPYRVGYRDGRFIVTDDRKSDASIHQYRKGSPNPIMQTGVAMRDGEFITDLDDAIDSDDVIVAYLVVSQAEFAPNENYGVFDGERFDGAIRAPDIRGGVIPITVPAVELRDDNGKIQPSLFKSDGTLRAAEARWDLMVHPGPGREQDRTIASALKYDFEPGGRVLLSTGDASGLATGDMSVTGMLETALERGQYRAPERQQHNGMFLASTESQMKPEIHGDTAVLDGPYQGIYTAQWDEVRPGYRSARESVATPAVATVEPSEVRTFFDPEQRGNSRTTVTKTVDSDGLWL